MIQLTLPAPEVAPLRCWEPVPALEEWALAAWEWQAMWTPYSLGKLMRRTPAGTATQDHVAAHFNEIGRRCWAVWTQIKDHQARALAPGLGEQQMRHAEREIDRQAAQMVLGEWVQIPKEVDYPAYDPALDCEMFEISGLEYLGRAELAEGVIWAATQATSADQRTPAQMTVAGLQHALDHRISRAERHLVFTQAALWARRTSERAKGAPEGLRGLLAYPIPAY